MYVINGKAFNSIRDVAKAYGLPYTTLLHRLDRDIPLDEAVNLDFVSHKQITVNGKLFTTFSMACKEYGVASSTALNRQKRGWTPEQIFGLAPKPKQVRAAGAKNSTSKSITVRGKVYGSRKEAADAHEFSYQKFINRLKKGLTPEQALELEPFPAGFVPGKGQFAVHRKKEREHKEQHSGKRTCSVCKEVKCLQLFHKSKKGENTFRCSLCTSKAFLRYRYGITVKDFQALILQQNNKCAICKNKLDIQDNGVQRSKNVAVDHCHTSGKVRGILCKNCNVGLGFFKDSVENLNAAILYLKQHP